MGKEIRKVVVLGANGAMGSGSGEVFAAAGIDTVFLARDEAKAGDGRARAIGMAKSEVLADKIRVGTYDRDLERECAGADLVFEALGEELELKKGYFARIDRVRAEDSIVATVSSGLSIAAMAAGQSESFARHFLGMHLFNPPNVIVGCELIPHAGTDPAITRFVRELLDHRLGRKAIETADLPAFCGNRVGFKVLNEVARLATEHGVAWIDQLVGPHTGRAMSPLATIDLVGWDVHRAIVDNLFANTKDEAHAEFELPAWMKTLSERGHLGDKTPDKGGFYKKVRNGKGLETWVLDPASGDYRPPAAVPLPDFVRAMKRLHRVGRYREALAVMMDAPGREADLLRRVVLGYVSYGLNRVGEVVREPADVDRIMAFGFNWAPPSVFVDLLGAKALVSALERAQLAVPAVVAAQVGRSAPLFHEPSTDTGRYFVGAA